MSDFDPIEASPRSDELPTRFDQFPPSGPNSLASIGRRFAGRIIDVLVLMLPAYLLLSRYIDPENTTDPYEGPDWLYYVLALVVPALYEILFIAWRGQTVGKLVMGIRVARHDDGGVPNPYQASVRALLPLAVANVPLQPISTLAAIAIYLLAITSPLRQGLHDRAAGTVVVSTK